MGVGATVGRKTNKDQTLSSSSSSLSNNTGGQNEIESHTSTVFSADSVFGSVPNQLEVNHAITAFQSFSFMMQGLPSTMSKSDGLQSSLNQQDTTRHQSTGFQRVYDAFLLLQTLPSVRRMVVSISCDAAVWDAILRNNEVQEFRRSLQQVAEARRLQRSGAETDFVGMALKWILEKMKLQIWEIIKNLKSVLLVVNNKSSGSPQNENVNTEAKQEFEETILLTVLMSTITLMIVLVTRASSPA